MAKHFSSIYFCGSFSIADSFSTDNTMMPPEWQKIFDRVRASADFMPTWQIEVSSYLFLISGMMYLF